MDSPSQRLDFDGAEAGPGSLARHSENFDVFINLVPIDGELVIECTYNLDLYDAETIRRRLDGFAILIQSLTANDDRPVSQLPVVSANELELLASWNETSASYDSALTLHGVFEQQAAADPESIALIFGDREVSYGELNARANQLARTILVKELDQDALIGVFMDRSIEMVATLFAVLKAGAGYVPLDPEYPAERLRLMIEHTDMPIILTQESLLSRLPSTNAIGTVVDSVSELLGVANPEMRVEPSATAYVIYTSGSTGSPKGVVVSHLAICNQMLWAQDKFRLDQTDRLLLKTPFSFDVSTWELFWPLLNGAQLVIAEPGGHRDPAYLVRTIVEQSITTALFVPSMLRMLLEHDSVGSMDNLKRVIASGEALTRDLQERFMAVMGAELHNLCGPTETTVHVTHWQCRDEDGGEIPIGNPVANTKAHILDELMQPVPIGAVGELHIGGSQVADGYLRRPDLTRARFVPDPFSDVTDARLYKTGDIARFRSDGAIEYLGRRDQQVKIRGNRVELGEIDATIRMHPDVGHAVTVLWNPGPGEERLVAYVTARGGDLDEGSVRGFVKGRLPAYMVPGWFVVVDELPITTSGKIDRAALPAPDQPMRPEGSEPVMARTPLESDIAAMWAEVLGTDQIGAHDDLFGLGGHSLDAMRVNARISELYQVELSLLSFFENPTVEGLALAVINAMAEQVVDIDELEALVAEIAAGDGEPETSAG